MFGVCFRWLEHNTLDSYSQWLNLAQNLHSFEILSRFFISSRQLNDRCFDWLKFLIYGMCKRILHLYDDRLVTLNWWTDSFWKHKRFGKSTVRTFCSISLRVSGLFHWSLGLFLCFEAKKVGSGGYKKQFPADCYVQNNNSMVFTGHQMRSDVHSPVIDGNKRMQ